MKHMQITRLMGGLALAAMLAGAQNARANFGGKVWCDSNCDGVLNAGEPGIPGLTINVYHCGDNVLITSGTTDANGNFSFANPPVTPYDNYYVCLGSIPSGMVVSPQLGLQNGQTNNTAGPNGCTPCFFWNIDGDYIHNNIGLCSLSGSCTPPPPPPCTNCVDAALGLGAAAGMSVLELGAASVSITGPAGGIIGDVGIAPNGKLSISGTEYITGTVSLGAGATINNSSAGSVNVIQPVDLSAQINAAYAAYANASNMPCSQTFSVLDGKTVTTIFGAAGVNVICVKDISLSGKQITLTGPASAKFIFNISGKLVLTGGGAGPQIRVDTSAGLQPSAVLYNLLGSGPDVAFSGGGGGVTCCAAIVDGTILAPYRKIALSPGLVNGEVISGMNISIVSGSSVRCPCQ